MIVRDPVHGLVSFERPDERIVVELLDTPEMQRLRRIRMLGVAHLAFPSAEHSRFVHAIGAAHVMTRFLARMQRLSVALPTSQQLSSDEVQIALAAALLHDVGHGPLSHLFEEVFEGAMPHEEWTSALLLDPDARAHKVLAQRDRSFPAAVERLVHGEHRLAYIARAVSGTFDVDRCDYLLRDSHATGVRYGLFDLEWLLRSLQLASTPASTQLAIDGAKGLPAVEGFFLARLFMYEQVYFHKTARAAEVMMRALFARAVQIVRDGGDAALPPVLCAMARGDRVTAAEYQTLDDASVWSALQTWEHVSDPVLRDLAARVRRRALFKSVALEDEDSARLDTLRAELNDVVARGGFDPRYYAHFDTTEVAAYEDSDGDTLQVAYPHRSPRTLGRASFLLGRLAGEKLVRRRLVFPAEVREKVHALLDR